MKKTALLLWLAAMSLGVLGIVSVVDTLALAVIAGALWVVRPIPLGSTPTREQKLANSVPGGIIVLAGLVIAAAHLWPQRSQTYQTLAAMHERLDAADKLGDFVAAQALFDPLASTLRTLNHAGVGDRPCQLAALHLVEAVNLVAAGGKWVDRSRFSAALAACK